MDLRFSDVKQNIINLGPAGDVLKALGKWRGRSRESLAHAVQRTMADKRHGSRGVVNTLCISPRNGMRLPCGVISIKQSIVGDCQSKSGLASVKSAKIKNKGALLGKDNILIESLLCAVSIGDYDVVKEIVDCEDAQSGRLTKKVWITGDNLYVSGLDMSWENLQLGDLLVFRNVVMVNTGYPHVACWKYGARAGLAPKEYINSLEGSVMRLRGIKAPVLFRNHQTTIEVGEAVRIVHRRSSEYSQILKSCKPPTNLGSYVVYRDMQGREWKTNSSNVEAYVNLLMSAGIDAAKIDKKRYRRQWPQIVTKALQASPGLASAKL